MCAVASKRSLRPRRSIAAEVPGAKRAPYPGFITPCDPALRARAPDGSQWLHEIKTIDASGTSSSSSSSRFAARAAENQLTPVSCRPAGRNWRRSRP
jgi:hypothetical protein